MRSFVLALAGVIVILTAAAPAAAAPVSPPDPAPGGPQRPYEADVPGPVNIDDLAVTARRTGPGLTVSFDRRSRTADDTVPAGARRFVFLFDRSLHLHLDEFPVCATETLAAGGPDGCPAGSLVGNGLGTQLDGSTTDVNVLNTRFPDGTRGVLVHLAATGTILPQTLERVSAPYRRDYRWALDEILPPTAVPPQDRPGTTRFQITFGATRTTRGRTVHLITQRGHDPILRAGLWSQFVTGQTILPVADFRPRP